MGREAAQREKNMKIAALSAFIILFGLIAPCFAQDTNLLEKLFAKLRAEPANGGRAELIGTTTEGKRVIVHYEVGAPNSGNWQLVVCEALDQGGYFCKEQSTGRELLIK
jgi:hypothetical protein